MIKISHFGVNYTVLSLFIFCSRCLLVTRTVFQASQCNAWRSVLVCKQRCRLYCFPQDGLFLLPHRTTTVQAWQVNLCPSKLDLASQVGWKNECSFHPVSANHRASPPQPLYWGNNVAHCSVEYKWSFTCSLLNGLTSGLFHLGQLMEGILVFTAVTAVTQHAYCLCTV